MNDICFGIGTLVECFFMILFINTTYTLKTHRGTCVIFAIIGYLAVWTSGVFASAVLFYIVFTCVNTVVLGVCCRLTIIKIILHGIIFSVLLFVSELIVIFSERDISFLMVFGQSVKFLIKSRIIYALGLTVFRSLTREIRVSDNSYSPFNITVHALSAVIAVITFEGLFSNRVYMIIYLMLIVINIASFAAWEIIVLRAREMQKVINENEKHYAELESYKLLSEKYESTRIMRHDIKEQLITLQALIKDGGSEAKKFAGKLESLGRELNYTEYTDNKVLNILLNRKIKECHENGIELFISSGGAKLDMIPELETVAIFSNIINNAMESCMRSEEKNIFIDLSILNGAFTVVKIENNCDIPPETFNGSLITQKNNGELHGVGMKSVENSLKSCGGKISWSYDKERRFFRTVIMFALQARQVEDEQ